MQLYELPVTSVKGVGDKTKKILKNLKIETVEDLFHHIPREYDDRSFSHDIGTLSVGARYTVTGFITRVGEFRPRRGMLITKAILEDDTGKLTLVWFNQPYLKNSLRRDIPYRVTGRVVDTYHEVKIESPEMEPVLSDKDSSFGLVPYYSLTKGLSQNALRKMIKEAMRSYGSEIEDLLPESVIEGHGLLHRKDALRLIHQPDSLEDAMKARRTMIFEELILFQLSIYFLRERIEEDNNGIAFQKRAEVETFLNGLPFQLTKGQETVLSEIFLDMYSEKRMNRLLQGDVGSGKTVVAMAALLLAAKNGYQGILMAPTEILARQHFDTICRFLAPYGLKIALLTGSTKAKEKREIGEAVENGSVHLVVGTHALIQDSVVFHKLGLVITDEQHRFGVFQRYLLGTKGLNPDILVMSATPIPRTLALTLYGDLDLSTIDSLPPGRQKIDTFLVGKKKVASMMEFIEQELQNGRQAYMVCPLIEGSDKMDQVLSAEELFLKVKKRFPQFRTALLHGRMKPEEKDTVMEQFKEKKIDILVSTTVIEVGIDVPNATIMVVFNAERFGLAQLHQLRGRVGRGSHKSYCILVEGSGRSESIERLKILSETDNGLKIAEMDLKRRGPGEFMGRRQHGMLEFKVADIMTDTDDLEVTRKVAAELLRQDPFLGMPQHENLKKTVLEKNKEMLRIDFIN